MKARIGVQQGRLSGRRPREIYIRTSSPRASALQGRVREALFLMRISRLPSWLVLSPTRRPPHIFERRSQLAGLDSAAHGFAVRRDLRHVRLRSTGRRTLPFILAKQTPFEKGAQAATGVERPSVCLRARNSIAGEFTGYGERDRRHGPAGPPITLETRPIRFPTGCQPPADFRDARRKPGRLAATRGPAPSCSLPRPL